MKISMNDPIIERVKINNKIDRIISSGTNKLIRFLQNFRDKFIETELLINERIVEYPLLFQCIRPTGKVLDLGCQSSRLPIQLASVGYEVVGIDTRGYPFHHPALEIIQKSLFEAKLSEESFDIITAISVVEHIGLGVYKDDVIEDGDIAAMKVLAKALKKGGQMIISVPFGKKMTTIKYRVYDSNSLKSLLGDLEIKNIQFFIREENNWRASSEKELSEVASPDLPLKGVVFLDLCKV